MLSRTGALVSVTLSGPLLGCVSKDGSQASTPSHDGLFSLGVASGEPHSDGVVLWTRLAPEPMETGGGMAATPVEVAWEVAADENMHKVVRRGTAIADPSFAHSVHVEVQGLEPARWYWYRFKAGRELSPIGRTRTAPTAGAAVDKLRFAVASCQNYESGYFTATRHMAGEDLDLVVFLGDYIYEGRTKDGRTRRHDGPTARTLEGYRRRYALYKSDPDLKACHAAFPWIVTWDDHEVANNYAGNLDGKGRGSEAFMRRRAAAYQAYYEHMPLRRLSMPDGPHMQIYRRLMFGNLASFHVLDTRQYRSVQPCGNKTKPFCDAVFDPAATMLGAKQEGWLFDGLKASDARWNVIAQQVPVVQRINPRDGIDRVNMDKWDGYAVARRRLLDFLSTQRPSNPVVLTGDVHESWVADLLADFSNPGSATVGTEFVATSISSNGDGKDITKKGRRMLEANAHLKFYNKKRGYMRCEVTPGRWRTDFRTVDYVTRRGAEISTKASFVVEDGRPGAKRLDGKRAGNSG